jgi:hypothetical protein
LETFPFDLFSIAHSHIGKKFAPFVFHALNRLIGEQAPFFARRYQDLILWTHRICRRFMPYDYKKSQ